MGEAIEAHNAHPFATANGTDVAFRWVRASATPQSNRSSFHNFFPARDVWKAQIQRAAMLAKTKMVDPKNQCAGLAVMGVVKTRSVTNNAAERLTKPNRTRAIAASEYT